MTYHPNQHHSLQRLDEEHGIASAEKTFRGMIHVKTNSGEGFVVFPSGRVYGEDEPIGLLE